MKLKIRRIMTLIDSREIDEAGTPAEAPLLKVALAVVVENPCAGRYVEDLDPAIKASVESGELLGIPAIGCSRQTQA